MAIPYALTSRTKVASAFSWFETKRLFAKRELCLICFSNSNKTIWEDYNIIASKNSNIQGIPFKTYLSKPGAMRIYRDLCINMDD
jgi:accessory colonization factor AcfC